MDTVSLAFKFGGQTYTFNGVDLLVDDLSAYPGFEDMCLSSVFVLGSVIQNNSPGTNVPAWIVGDAFLKNVYSVFRSVGVSFIHPRALHYSLLIQTCPRYETTPTGAITGSVGFAKLSGVDGRLITNGPPMYSATSSGVMPTVSGVSSSIIPNASNTNSPSSGANSSRLQSRGFEYGALVLVVLLFLSPVW
jgi:hypothetical protein